MAWKNIPEKKVLATLKDGKSFKGAAAEKMTIYVDGDIPGSEGDVKGVSVTVDPSTYIMTTQLKDSKGGNVGSPATVDLPLESMVVGGEYDDATKKVILTLKNGETVEFSVADLVAGLQSEITPQNPLSADLVAETSNKNFVTSEEKEDISSISGLADNVETLNTNVEGLQSGVSGLKDDVNNLAGDVSALQSDLGNKQDTIDGSNPLDASFIDDENSDKKLVTPEEKGALNSIVSNDPSRLARFEDNGDDNATALMDDAGNYLQFEANRFSQYGEVSGVTINNSRWSYLLQNGAGSPINHFAGDDGATYLSGLPCGLYAFDADSMTLYVTDDKSQRITQDGTIIAGSEYETTKTFTFIPADGSPAINYVMNINTGEVEEKPLGGGGEQGTLYINPSDLYVGALSNGINIYSDPEMTQRVHSSTIDGMLDAGDIRVKLVDSSDPSWLGENKDGVIMGKYWDGDPAVYAYVMLLPFYSSDVSTTNGLTIYYMYEPNNDYTFYSFGPNLIATANEIENTVNAKIREIVLSGSGAPTNRTAGTKGQLYQDTSNGKVYICTNRSGSTYTWKEVIKNGDNISTLTNDAGYQNASQVSSAIASAVGDITSFEYQVVQTLPQTGEKGVVYLVPNSGTTPNIYDEYIYVNNAFEKIGTTEMDLSNYYTKTQTDTLLGAKADQSTTYTKTEVDTALGNKANSSDVYTKTQVDTALGNKANSSDVYSKSEVDTALAGKVDAVNPADLPSGAYQGSVVVTDDKENIDPSSVEEGQIVVDPTTKIVYVISKETEPGTTTETLVFTEVGKEQVVFLPMTITDLQALTFSMDNTVAEINTMINAGMSVFYRLVLPQAVSGLQAGTYDFRPFYSSNAAILCSMLGASSTNTIMGVAWHTASGTPYLEMRSLQNQITSSNKLSADLIDNSTSDNKTYETGTGAPTTSTAGSVGELYVDKSTGTVYVCTSTTGGTYTWEPVSGGSGPTVVQTTGQSTTSVMSQKAVTDAIEAVDGVSITMTYTDPGEGSSLQANHFIAVYEA